MIETVQDWNERLVNGCCGCTMPVCPTPVMICEAKYAQLDRDAACEGITYDASGDLYAGDPMEYQAFHPAWTDSGSLDEVGTIYRKRTVTYEDETFDVEIGDPILENYWECTSATVKTFVDHNYDGAGHVTISRTTHTLSEPLTKAEFAAMALAKMEEEEWESRDCRALTGMLWATFPEDFPACAGYIPGITTFGATATSTKLRFRFRIDDSHLGAKFWITYDVGEFLEEEDPSFLSEDNPIEWIGPGTGDEEDESWLTDWIEIEPPDDPGQRRVVNIRFTCYTGTKFGVKPQVMGESLEIPPP